MKVTVIGSGYVGLVSGVMMSHFGHEVTCVDIDEAKIERLKNLGSPIFEEGLEKYVKKFGNTKNLEFTCGYDDSIYNSSAIFIAVDTPSLPDGSAKLEHVFQAALMGARYANPGCIFVIKSTVPPGTCQEIKNLLRKHGFNHQLVSNPEFLRQGSAIWDFLNPDRIIVGCESTEAQKLMRQVYKPLLDQGAPIVETDLITAELIKYASNGFLASKIAYINEMADLCEAIGADINQLSVGVGLDKRIGPDFLKAGPGFGGSCFPKDILALQHLAREAKSDFLILDAVIKANGNRASLIISKIKGFLGGGVKGKKLAILGLTYKAGTDDMRSSPALEIINLLQKEGAEITAYDPQGMSNASKYFDGRLVCSPSAAEAAKDADAIIVVTEWPEFVKLDFRKLYSQLKSPNIIDLRNILDKKKLTKLGYNCYFLGQRD